MVTARQFVAQLKVLIGKSSEAGDSQNLLFKSPLGRGICTWVKLDGRK